MELQVLVWKAEPTKNRRTRDSIYRRVLHRFAEEDIEIPYPVMDLRWSEERAPDRG